MNIIVSFPRSGQHLVEKILKYCCNEHNVEFKYCEFYGCCNSIPCSKGNEISKNHDFKLYLDINNNYKYVALHRKDLILQLEAYYRYHIGINEKKYKYKDLLKFIKKNTNYYNDFVNKWINNENKNILKIEYYELLENPEKVSKKIFKHLFPNIILKSKVFKSLNSLEVEVNNTPGVGIFYHKISLINKIDTEIYNKLKKDLEI